MAVFKASTPFDIGTFNLGKLFTNLTATFFYDNFNEITGSPTEQDLRGLQYVDGPTRSAYFGGSGFTLNQAGALTAGTVHALSLFTGNLLDFTSPNWVLNAMSVSALDMQAAAKTVGVADDLALLTKVLSGADRFVLSEGSDTVNGFAGADKIFGNGGNDNLSGGLGNDTLSGGEGDDILNGGAGDDGLGGGNGFDRVVYTDDTAAVTIDLRITIAQNTGGSGTDTLYSIEAVDGSAFNDVLRGNNVANSLNGGKGDDLLAGGGGQDSLTGGVGADKFLFDTSIGGTGPVFDTITDFSHAQLDQIQLSKAVFKGLAGAAGTALSADAFYAAANATGAHDASDRIIYNTTSGALYYDADGTGSAAAIQIALIGATTHPALVAGYFLIVA